MKKGHTMVQNVQNLKKASLEEKEVVEAVKDKIAEIADVEVKVRSLEMQVEEERESTSDQESQNKKDCDRLQERLDEFEKLLEEQQAIKTSPTISVGV